MSAGAEFPPVVLYGTNGKWWIGDGWHRVLAAKEIGAEMTAADIRPGGRADAIKYALGANQTHGARRTNEDKRRCVEVALREFPDLSSRAIAELCGVSDHIVNNARDQLQPSSSSPRTGRDGKKRRASKKCRAAAPETRAPEEIVADPEPAAEQKPEDKPRKRRAKLLPPSNGLQFADLAIMDLEQIHDDDTEKTEAFNKVRSWLDEHEANA
jgi:hypothetical protein